MCRNPYLLLLLLLLLLQVLLPPLVLLIVAPARQMAQWRQPLWQLVLAQLSPHLQQSLQSLQQLP
jgi:hypothetical protein